MLTHRHIDCAREGCYAVITVHPQEEARLRRTHESFYCPAGHGNHFAGKTPEEKERDKLERDLKNTKRQMDRWREQWEAEKAVRDQLVQSVQVCPLGCGYRTHRRLPWQPDDLQRGRFLDRVGSDLAAHLRDAHNATAVVRLLEAGDRG